MRLWLIRHGTALSKDQDPQRPLSEAGRRQASATAERLSSLGVQTAQVWHSDKLRAQQTAESVAQALGGTKIHQQAGLAPNDPPEVLAGLARSAESDLVVVGHLPHLARVTSLLLTGEDQPDLVDFPAAGLVCLERGSGERFTLTLAAPPLLDTTGSLREDFHAHIYFTAETRDSVLALRQELESSPDLPVDLQPVRETPMGPHPTPMFNAHIDRRDLGVVAYWLMRHHGPHSILVHPNTGDDLADHTRHALWLGEPLDLNLDNL